MSEGHQTNCIWSRNAMNSGLQLHTDSMWVGGIFSSFWAPGCSSFPCLETSDPRAGIGRRARRRGESLPKEIDAWLHIGENGKITVYTGKAEMGQNIRTSLSQAVAEELHVPIDQIELVMGDTQLTPFDMGTFGSRTTPTMNLQLRKVAAAARETLIGLAAQQWQTDRKGLIADDGKITDAKSKRSVKYADADQGTADHAGRYVGAGSLIPARNWKVAGQSAPKGGRPRLRNGRHRYPSDQKLPDMLYGKSCVLRLLTRR